MLFSKVQHFLKTQLRGIDPAVPYEIACSCGRQMKGLRKSRHQVVPCPACGRPTFILPFSPLPAVAPAGGQATGVLPGKPKDLGPWKKPLMACAFTCAAKNRTL